MSKLKDTEIETVTIAAVAKIAVINKRGREGWRYQKSEGAGRGRLRLYFAKGPETERERLSREVHECEVSLNPCPFCGAPGVIVEDANVHCDRCGARGPAGDVMHPDPDPVESAVAWNTRAAFHLTTEVDSLVFQTKSAVKKMVEYLADTICPNPAHVDGSPRDCTFCRLRREVRRQDWTEVSPLAGNLRAEGIEKLAGLLTSAPCPDSNCIPQRKDGYCRTVDCTYCHLRHEVNPTVAPGTSR